MIKLIKVNIRLFNYMMQMTYQGPWRGGRSRWHFGKKAYLGQGVSIEKRSDFGGDVFADLFEDLCLGPEGAGTD
jgi:hypothetical protein